MGGPCRRFVSVLETSENWRDPGVTDPVGGSPDDPIFGFAHSGYRFLEFSFEIPDDVPGIPGQFLLCVSTGRRQPHSEVVEFVGNAHPQDERPGGGSGFHKFKVVYQFADRQSNPKPSRSLPPPKE